MPQPGRLRRSAEFGLVVKCGRRYADRAAVLYVLRTGGDCPRAGFSVGKRLGKAVVRNRVKRLFREAYASYYGRIAGGVDLVFVARPAAREMGFHDVRQAIRSLLERSGLLEE